MYDDLFAEPFDETHQALRAEARRFTQAEIAPHAFEWEEAESFDRALYPKAANAGLLGPTMPPGLGGGGGDVFHGIVVAEELLRGGCTGAVVGLGSLEIALPPILTLGTDAQKQRFVPPVLAGERIAALAITEPGTGSDVAGVRTRAERDGDDYLISGTKTFITSGVRADLLTVLARTGSDPHQGLTFFVVERGMPGLAVSKKLAKTGWRASDTAELSFDQVRVPVSNRLGQEGTGFVALMHNFAGERLTLAVQGYQLAQVALEDALAYAQQREAFGRPIARFQVVRHKLAQMATQVASAKALTYQVAKRMQDDQAAMAEVAMAKNAASTVACEVTWQAVQIFGGMGYMRETRAERYARDARLLPIGGGTEEIMNEIVAKGMGL